VPKDVVNTLVVVRLDTNDSDVTVLVQGADFYSSPRFNPINPSELAYYAWDHPNMPWDHTRVYVANLDISNSEVKLASPTCIAGQSSDREESNNQPRYGADGVLYFQSDRTGFWNIHSYKNGKVERVLKEPI